MKVKRMIALLLCVAMLVAVLTGCGGGEDAKNSSSPSSETSQSSTGADSSSDDNSEVSAKNYEHADITMLVISPMPNEDAYAAISKEMSKITEEKFNATINIMGVSISDYANKINLALASGDPLDIFQGFILYNQFVSMGYMLNLDPYADMLQDAFDTVGDTVRQGYHEGSLYSLPIINLGGTGGDAYAFRKDIIDELEIDLTKYASFPDLEEVLVKIKEAHPEITPLMSGGANGTIQLQGDPYAGVYFDGLNNQFCNIDPAGGNGKVEVGVKREYWKKLTELAWDWAQKGLLGYDELSVDYDNIKAGRAAGMVNANGPSALQEAESVSGYEMVLWEPQNMAKPYITTLNNWSWSVTEYTKYPEQSVAILNELYTNPELSNLLVWGIEGEHYRLVDEEKGLVDFLEGEHPGNAKYYNLIKDNVPNLYICYEGVNDIPDKYKAYQNWKENRMQISPYLGFTPNEDEYANEATACKNVMDQYTVALLSGQLDPATAYDKMLGELDAAGIETIRETIQNQLDAWIAENS